MAWMLALLAGLSVTGASLSLRSAAEFAAPAVGGPGAAHATLIVILYAAMLVTLVAAGGVPLAWYGDFLLEHRYGLSNQRPGSWLRRSAEVVRHRAAVCLRRLGCPVRAHPLLAGALVAACRRRLLPHHRRPRERRAGSPAAAVFARETPRPRVAADAAAQPCRTRGCARAGRLRMGFERQDQEGQRRADGPRSDAPDSGLGHHARRVLRRGDRGRSGARARAPRARRYLEGHLCSRAC